MNVYLTVQHLTLHACAETEKMTFANLVKCSFQSTVKVFEDLECTIQIMPHASVKIEYPRTKNLMLELSAYQYVFAGKQLYIISVILITELSSIENMAECRLLYNLFQRKLAFYMNKSRLPQQEKSTVKCVSDTG